MPRDGFAFPYMCLIVPPYASCLTLGVTHFELFLWSLGSQSQSKGKSWTSTYAVLKQLLGVRKSTSNQIVLAEFGRFPLQIHFWLQIFALSQPTSCSTKQPAWQTSINWWALGQQPFSQGWNTFRQLEIWCALVYWPTWATGPLWRVCDKGVDWGLSFWHRPWQLATLEIYRTVYKANRSVYQYTDYLSTSVYCQMLSPSETDQ